LEAEITLSYEDEREAEAVAKAVSPDNVEVPPGLFVRTTREGFKVFTRVRCETRLQTFMATIDDLLSCISIAEKAFSVAKGFKAHSDQSTP
jgi:hypothetical protein